MANTFVYVTNDFSLVSTKLLSMLKMYMYMYTYASTHTLYNCTLIPFHFNSEHLDHLKLGNRDIINEKIHNDTSPIVQEMFIYACKLVLLVFFIAI